METYRSSGNVDITLRSHDGSVVDSEISELKVEENPIGNAAASGELIPESPNIEFDDIMHESKSFDIHLSLASGRKTFKDCKAVSASPKSLQWKCASIN